MDIVQYVDEDVDMLECRISSAFIKDTQIVWPGREVRANSSWFTCTIRHTAGKYRATAILLQEQREETSNPGQLIPGIAKQSHVSGNRELDPPWGLPHVPSTWLTARCFGLTPRS